MVDGLILGLSGKGNRGGNMFKAYLHVMIVQLLVLAYIAGKPKPVNMVKELKVDGMKFEQDDGIRLMDIR